MDKNKTNSKKLVNLTYEKTEDSLLLPLSIIIVTIIISLTIFITFTALK